MSSKPKTPTPTAMTEISYSIVRKNGSYSIREYTIENGTVKSTTESVEDVLSIVLNKLQKQVIPK